MFIAWKCFSGEWWGSWALRGIGSCKGAFYGIFIIDKWCHFSKQVNRYFQRFGFQMRFWAVWWTRYMYQYVELISSQPSHFIFLYKTMCIALFIQRILHTILADFFLCHLLNAQAFILQICFFPILLGYVTGCQNFSFPIPSFKIILTKHLFM